MSGIISGVFKGWLKAKASNGYIPTQYEQDKLSEAFHLGLSLAHDISSDNCTMPYDCSCPVKIEKEFGYNE